MTIPSVLIDSRNWDAVAPLLVEKIHQADLIGFDLESYDEPHPALVRFRGKKTIFDIRRTTVTGFSLYIDGDDAAYYVNLNHADAHNRVAWDKARVLLDAKRPDAEWVIHNAAFELVMMEKALGYRLANVLCSLQLCVSAYGPDEYDYDRFMEAGWGGLRPLLGKAERLFRNYDPGRPMTPEQAEVFLQVVGKQSKAKHSYNGYVEEIAYGYGLKKAVKSWFGHEMTTYEGVLKTHGAKHMGELTGEQVVAYGADDAYWCVRLFHRVLQYMVETNPAAIEAYRDTENPMVYVYADLWKTGLRVDTEAIARRREEERANFADTLRGMKKAVRELLPFPTQPHAGLMESEEWYRKNWQEYRRRIEQWANSPDSADDFAQAAQVRGAVSNAWAADLGRPEPTGLNLTHYMVMRTIMYDLFQEPVIRLKGKVQSDDEARGRMLERVKSHAAKTVLGAITEMAGIEQRMKLYLTPYTALADPDTGRMYPVISSRLATHRMAGSNPNPMQWAKHNPSSTYVRGFIQADSDDEVLVSIDWSQIELVLIGEFSGDPEFARAYGQVPYQDLHLGAAADALSVVIPEITEALLVDLHHMTAEEVEAINPAILLTPSGEKLPPDKAKKFWRTIVGKGSNFNYWYSGALSSVGETLGWTADLMWAATEKYRKRFAVAEAWRVNTIHEAQNTGFVAKPDGLRRVKFEATPLWREIWQKRAEMSGGKGLQIFVDQVVRKIQTRANNQIVNAKIQGSCATLAKRSILRIDDEIRGAGYRARFKTPIHDELMYSVHRREVADFVAMAKGIMCDHPDIISNLKIDASASIGLNFEPWHPKKAPLGQIELDEAPALPCLPKETEGGRLDADQIREVVDWLYRARENA